MSRAPRLRFVHTSDLHLGCEHLPHAVVADALRGVVDAAQDLDADALLVAGDVMDHNLVPDALVRHLVSELERFGRPCFVLPGNHDAYDDTSVYHRPSWHDRPPFIHLVDSTTRGACFAPELGLEVWGRPIVDHWREFRPLQDVPRRTGDHWRVAMAHGHFETPGEPERSSPIFPEHIASADSDYVALGHWDRMADVSQGDVVAYYSGAPHGAVGKGRALLVTLDAVSGTEVEVISVAPVRGAMRGS